MQYTFNTKSVFLLGKFMNHFQDEIDEIVGLIPVLVKVQGGADIFEHVAPDQLMGIITRVVTKSAEAEDLAIEFLSNATRLEPSKIREMDGYTFLAEFKSAMMSIDWVKLLKESIGLTLTPQPNPSGAQLNQPNQPQTNSTETSGAVS